MKTIALLGRSLLVLGLVPAFAEAATATSPFGPPTVIAGVICPPAISQTSPSPGGPSPLTVSAQVGCPNGTSSSAWAELQSIRLLGDSYNGSISGAPDAVTDLLPLVTPTRPYSHVELAVATSHVDDFSIPWVKLTFDIAWYGSDPGVALRLRIWEYRSGSQVLRYDVTHVGPISLQETFSLEGADVLDFTVEGRVIATSTPEPATTLLVGMALLIVGWGGRTASRSGSGSPPR